MGGNIIIFQGFESKFPFDHSFKLANIILPEAVIRYAGVYAKSITPIPNETITLLSEEYRSDCNYLIRKFDDTKLIVIFEHQSYVVSEDRLIKMAHNALNIAVMKKEGVLLIIFTDEETYKNSYKFLGFGPSIKVIPRYFYLKWSEIKKRLNILDEIIINGDGKLDEMKHLDLAFLPIISPKDKRAQVARKCIELYEKIKIDDPLFDVVVKFCLSQMASVYLPQEDCQAAYEVIGMLSYEEALDIFADQIANETKNEIMHEVDEIKEKNTSLEVENGSLREAKLRHEKFLDKLVHDGVISQEDIDDFESSLESD